MIRNLLKNVAGEYEIGRVLLAGSGLAAVVSPIAFQIWHMVENGGQFDVVAWCTAYPGGLAALNGIGVFAIGKKEKDIAAARATPGSSTETTATRTTTTTSGEAG